MASAERLTELKAERQKAKAKLNARSGQPGYGANAETLRAIIGDLDNQIAALEAELAPPAEDDTNGQGGAP